MGELDLKNHFIQKLGELRMMKEEYYQCPEEPDPLEKLKARATATKIRLET